jgi:pseudaminic acid synthase
MNAYLKIKDGYIGPGHPCYVVAEMSANHNQSFDDAVKIIEAAKYAGANAIKLQTYTPDTLTIDCNSKYFQISGGIWEGRSLYELYGEAYTPWEWHLRLKEIADSLNLDIFSTPFDVTAVDFLEKMEVPAYKIASFEIVDLPLIRRIAETAKPIILSTGMATLAEIDEAVSVIRDSGNNQLALLKCTSAYPAMPEDMNLETIAHLSRAFNVPTGLSDHTLGIAVPVAAVALGACIVEKHLTLDRSESGPDSGFSLEPDEFKAMVEAVRTAEKAVGRVHYGVSQHESRNRIFRRSLFVVQNMKAGEQFTTGNLRSIRPGHGLHPRYLEDVLGRYAAIDINRGTPLKWDFISKSAKDR